MIHRSDPHHQELDRLLRAWARWRLAGSYPKTSILYRAALLMPPSPNRPGSRTPGYVDASEQVLHVHRLLTWLATAGYGGEVEAVTVAYLGLPGCRTLTACREQLGLTEGMFKARRQRGFDMLTALWRWEREQWVAEVG